MATSDVLQFHYSIENEVARNATKGFAGLLGEAFERYKKLWNEYLKLRKYCEDVDVNIPFAVLESESYQNEVVAMPTTSQHCAERCKERASQASSENTNVLTSVYESVSNACSSDITSDFDDTVLSDNKCIQKQMVNDELLRSPILVKRRSKSRRNSIVHGRSILEDSEGSSMCVPIKENITILINSSQEDISKVPVESNEMECSFTENNNDQIDCTPISKMPKRLGVSKLYNVDTILLQNGKKLKQSKLVFLPTEQTTDNGAKENVLRPHISPTPEKNIKANSKNRVKSVDEEIIESSPTKRVKTNLKIKSLKLRRKSPIKHIEKHPIFDRFFDNKTNSTKPPVTNINLLSQCLPVHTSTQNDEPYLIKRSKTVASSCNESIGTTCDIPSSPFSPVLVNSGDLYFEDFDFDTDLSTPVKETKEAAIAGNDNQAQKRKFSESTNQTQNYNSTTCDDETFFMLGENLKENPTCNIDRLKEKVPQSKILQFPPVKKSLMDSFDIPPEKKDVSTYKSSKNKTERAKMTGVSCWECKQYYANLGLSENEIKARQNQCSRHRTKYNERQSTPEGFWDPLFPETFSSTFQDD